MQTDLKLWKLLKDTGIELSGSLETSLDFSLSNKLSSFISLYRPQGQQKAQGLSQLKN